MNKKSGFFYGIYPQIYIKKLFKRDKQLRRWNQDCLDSQMDGCHVNQGSLHFMLSKSKTTTGETRIYSWQERSDLDTRTDQMWLSGM